MSNPVKLLPKHEIIKRLRALLGDRISEMNGATRITLGMIGLYMSLSRGILYDYALQRGVMSDDMQLRLSRVLIEIEQGRLVLGVVGRKGVLVRSQNVHEETRRETASIDWNQDGPKIQWGGGKLCRS